jgi:hypothetical protein
MRACSRLLKIPRSGENNNAPGLDPSQKTIVLRANTIASAFDGARAVELGKAPTGQLSSTRGQTARMRRSEPGADLHFHRRRIDAETSAERRHLRSLVIEAHIHWRCAAAGDHPPGLRGGGQLHRLKVFRASRASDAVAAEHHKCRAAVGTGRGRPVGGCREPLGVGWQSSQ